MTQWKMPRVAYVALYTLSGETSPVEINSSNFRIVLI